MCVLLPSQKERFLQMSIFLQRFLYQMKISSKFFPGAEQLKMHKCLLVINCRFINISEMRTD